MASYELDFEYPSDLRANGTVEWIEANAIGNLEEEMNKVAMCRRWRLITRYLGCIDMVAMGSMGSWAEVEGELGGGGQWREYGRVEPRRELIK